MFFILLVTVVVALVGYYKWILGYWQRRGIPGPPGRLFLGNFWEINDATYPGPLVLRDWTKKYGKFYGIQEGTENVLISSDPEFLNEVFVRQFDNFHGRKLHPITGDVDSDPKVHMFEAQGLRWKRMRTISAPSFSAQNLKKVRPLIEESVHGLTKCFDEALGKSINIHDYFQEYTMDVIFRIAMGQKESRYFNNPFIKPIQTLFNNSNRHPVILFSVANPFVIDWKDIFGLLSPVGRDIKMILDSILKAIEDRERTREEHAKSGQEKQEAEDFIDLFLDTQSEEMEMENSEYKRSNVKVSKKMTKNEIMSQCFLFLLAGFDTTANSLAYTTFLLLKNPDKMKKLIDEIETVCGDDMTVSYEQLGELKYLENCMKEALRHFPLASLANSRKCMKETKIGDLVIEKGCLIWGDAWTIHFDKSIWGENAEEFVPERFDNLSQQAQTAWLPFGSGPRMCIGMRLAYMVEKLCLAHILRKYTITKGPDFKDELKLKGSSTISPETVNVILHST